MVMATLLFQLQVNTVTKIIIPVNTGGGGNEENYFVEQFQGLKQMTSNHLALGLNLNVFPSPSRMVTLNQKKKKQTAISTFSFPRQVVLKV